jgi:hypothetical protein
VVDAGVQFGDGYLATASDYQGFFLSSSNAFNTMYCDGAYTEPYRNTGDTAFAQQILPWLEGQLSYDATLTDGDGLIVTGPQISTTNGGHDWDFYDGAKAGVVTEFNELYYQDLRDVAYIEANLGNAAKAAPYDQTADQVHVKYRYLGES